MKAIFLSDVVMSSKKFSWDGLGKKKCIKMCNIAVQGLIENKWYACAVADEVSVTPLLFSSSSK